MNNLILPISDCRSLLESMQTTMEIKLPQEPNQLKELLSDLASLLATSAQVVASYQYHVDTERLTAVQEAKKQGYSGNMAKEFCAGRIAQVYAEFKLADRYNSTLVHQIDAARSILSYCKQENFSANLQRG